MMEDLVFEALRAAVTISKNENIRSTSILTRRLAAHGFGQETINAAILFWAKHVRAHNQQARA